MLFFNFLAATATLFCTIASARINGFSAPSTVVPGAPIAISIHTENYIQSVQDVAIAFGITPVESYYPQTLGTLMGEKFLGPNSSNILSNITADLTIPTSRPEGPATITAALFSLYGASLTGSVEYFAVNVTIGKETSDDYVTSKQEVVQTRKLKWAA